MFMYPFITPIGPLPVRSDEEKREMKKASEQLDADYPASSMPYLVNQQVDFLITTSSLD